jgi:hypothetical protein
VLFADLIKIINLIAHIFLKSQFIGRRQFEVIAAERSRYALLSFDVGWLKI